MTGRMMMLLPLALALVGCGPMAAPITPRLDEKEQAQVDQIWTNILTPPNRLDHDMLIDVLLMYPVYQVGVDKLHMTAEQKIAGGTALIEVNCFRATLEKDTFSVTLIDANGVARRRESYTRKEIEARMEALTKKALPTPVDENGQRQETPEQKRRREWVDQRYKDIAAATQPAAAK